MQALAAAAIGLLVAASLAVGFRLVALHRRTRAAPELLLGVMLLLSVGLGYPLMIVNSLIGGEWASAFQVTSTFAVNTGFSLLFAFTWRAFHPQAAWARTLAAIGMLSMLAAAVRRAIQVATQGPFDVTSEPLSDVLIQCIPVITAYLWTAWESLRYYAMMRRRVRLGLADPTVCNRFLLWGLMAIAVTLGVVVNVVALAQHVEAFKTPSILLLSSTTGLAQVVLLVLTFMPPSSYSSWVRSRAAARGA